MKTLLSLFLGLLIFNLGFSQKSPWKKAESNLKASDIISTKMDLPTKTLFDLDVNEMVQMLKSSPLREKSLNSNVIIDFPNSKGKMESFKVFEAPVMHPDLAAKYPGIKSYAGQGISDPSARIRFSIAPSGLQSMRFSGKGEAVFIEPITRNGNTYTIYKRAEKSSVHSRFECLVNENTPNYSKNINKNFKNADDSTLRTYRLAVSTNGEYTQFHGGTKAGAMAAINASMTRVNGVFENDFAVTMVLIANNDDVIYTNSSTDPYSNGSFNSQLQSTLTSVIGEANYDIGHLFALAGDNGNAGCIGCVCVDGSKGSAFTSRGTPQGDEFDIDYVAHEIGHQFGGNHTFSFRNEGTNAHYEPGSGSTIMGYAGITGATDVQQNSDPYFHFYTIEQVTNYVKSTSCQTNTNTGNTIPTANAGSDYTIPQGTAFVLTASGSDADGDPITYCWEQADENDSAHTNPSTTTTSGVSFRSYNPTTSNTRYFPRLETIKTGATSWQWEAVPTVTRALNFRVTVRDNRAGGAGNNSDDMRVNVTANAGPFVVNFPNTNVSWEAGSSQTITWNVAGTTGNGINAANVDILLSTDGGDTYTTTLASAVTNDGSHTIIVPNLQGNQNRIMVRGSGNIFFDISNTNFEINGEVTPDTEAPSNPTNLIASNETESSIDLSWDASTDNVGVTGYDVYQDGALIASVTGTTYQVTGLSSGTSYSFSIKAKDAADNISGFSNTATATTLAPDTEAPSAPTNLSASNATNSTIDISWNASTDNVGVTGYDIYQDGTLIASVTGTTYQATGLSSETSYSFSVKAKDAAGNTSGFSNTATATTLAGGNGCSNGITTLPYAESFENTLGDWSQSTNDDINWTNDANGTPSRNTGPSSGADGSYYMYIEASGNGAGYPNKRAILNSPCFDLSGETQASFSFQYHMYGSNMGTLTLEASNDDGATWTSLWTESGNQGNSWNSETIDLSSYTGDSVQLRFNGITGSSWRGDMAIDDINLTSGIVSCTDVTLTLNLDNYPEETSWQIINSSSQVVASGGTYGSQPDGSTVSVTECLDAGSYTFTINDTFGDGICCSYGNGSYTLTTGSTTLASGAAFGSSESTTFSLGGSAREAVVQNFVTTKAIQISTFPNPVGSERMINVVAPTDQVSFNLYDLQGRKVLEGITTNKSINATGIEAGPYIISLRIGGKTHNESIIFR